MVWGVLLQGNFIGHLSVVRLQQPKRCYSPGCDIVMFSLVGFWLNMLMFDCSCRGIPCSDDGSYLRWSSPFHEGFSGDGHNPRGIGACWDSPKCWAGMQLWKDICAEVVGAPMVSPDWAGRKTNAAQYRSCLRNAAWCQRQDVQILVCRNAAMLAGCKVSWLQRRKILQMPFICWEACRTGEATGEGALLQGTWWPSLV